jgi:hypothetical protein
VPTRRTFDLFILMGLLFHPALGIVQMAARRWSREAPRDSALETVGDTLQVLG